METSENPVIKKFNIKELNIGKLQFINNLLKCNIFYQKKMAIFQTPLCLIPSFNDTKKYKNIIRFKLITTDFLYNQKTKEYIKMLDEIDTFIKNYYERKIKEKLKNKTEPISFYKSYLENNNKTNVYFTYNIQIYNNKPIVDVYDYNHHLKPFDYILPNSECYCLLWLKNIWINENKYGLNWEIIQIKVFPPIHILEYCFIDDNNTNHIINNQKIILYKDHPRYSKFFKMKKMGVNVNAIRQQMKMENINPDILDKGEENCNESSFKGKGKEKGKGKGNIPPPPPPLLLNNKSTSFGLKDVLKDLHTVKLKKVNNYQKKPISIHNDPRVPSLHEILTSKSKLKSRN